MLGKGYWWIPIGPWMLRNRPSLHLREASSGAKDEKLLEFEQEDEVQPFFECTIHKSPQTGGAKCGSHQGFLPINAYKLQEIKVSGNVGGKGAKINDQWKCL